MNKRVTLLVLGFAIAGSGLFALILSLVGLKLNYLMWIDTFGSLPGFLIRLAMIMGGALLLTLGTVDWQREREDIRRYEAEVGQRP